LLTVDGSKNVWRPARAGIELTRPKDALVSEVAITQREPAERQTSLISDDDRNESENTED